MTKCLKIGLTGGIGSGKSTIAQIFSCLSIPIYYADDRAKYVMQYDPDLKSALKTAFGTEIFDGAMLNRTYLAGKVFSDANKLRQLNELVHPAVAKDFDRWCEEQKTLYVLKESALGFETGAYKLMDGNILVTAPVQLRINRVLARDAHRSIDDIERIMHHQWIDDQKIPLADYVIINDDQSRVLPQVLAIHESIIKNNYMPKSDSLI